MLMGMKLNIRQRLAWALGCGARTPSTADWSRGTNLECAKWRPTHQHKKGGEYRVLGHGILEADRSDVVIYDDKDGQIWVRSTSEFYDGRFAPKVGISPKDQ